MTDSSDNKKMTGPLWRYRYIPAVLMLLVGIICSIVLFKVAARWEYNEMQADFESAVPDRAFAIEATIQDNIQALDWIAGFYAGSQKVERDEFHTLLRTYLKDKPGIQALEWIPRVTHSERVAYEAAAREDGFPDFQITERKEQQQIVQAGQRKEYFPVYFVEPYKGNETVLGFDLASDPVRLKALQKSRDTGQIVATARITLVQEATDQFGFLVFKPIYKKDAATDSIQGRRQNLRGFALGVFRVKDIVESAIKQLEPQGINIQLSDLSVPANRQFLSFHTSRMSKHDSSKPNKQQQDQSAVLSHTSTLDVAGRNWQVVCTAEPYFIKAEQTWQPMALLVCGLCITVLLTAYLLVVTIRISKSQQFTGKLLNTKSRLEEEIKQREQFEQQIIKLAKFPDENPNPVLRVSNDGSILYSNKAGKSLLDLWQCRTGESIPKQWYQYITDAIQKEMAQKTEIECKDKIFSLAFAPVVEFNYVNIYALDITQRSKTEERIQRNIKHLNCFYGLSRFLEKPQISLEQIFQHTISLIHDAYQHPDKICIRITFDGLHYKSDNFNKSELSQLARIKVRGEDVGGIEVYWIAEQTQDQQTPFLKEERDLLDIVAEHLGRIAERTQAREKLQLLRNLIERSNDSIFVLESQWGRLLDVNERACETLGYTKEELLDMTLRDIDESISDETAWHEKIGQLKQKGDIVIQGRQKHKDRTTFFAETSLNLVSQKKQDYIIAVARDVTERKKAEQVQTRLLAEVEGANRELQDFAHIVSHDLKAPLRGVATLANWIVNDYADKLDEQGKEQMQLLISRVERMKNLIGGILAYSRVGQAREEKSQINLNELINEVIDMVAPPPNIEITVENELPVIEAEETRIMQVFQNLLSNAIKYMDKPEGRVKIGCVEENDFWKFSVADNGPGIEEKHFDDIFKIFQTLSARDEFESTGVGLTVIKKIVELYNGRIWIESEFGEGSTFFFTLPKREMGAADEKLKASVAC